MCGANQINIWTKGPSIRRGCVVVRKRPQGTWVPRFDVRRKLNQHMDHRVHPIGGHVREPRFPTTSISTPYYNLRKYTLV